jgi:hypothetical protein
MDGHPQDESKGIDDKVALASLNLLASVVASRPPFSVVLALCESTTPAVGSRFLPEASRAMSRSLPWSASSVPSSRQRLKYHQAVIQEGRSCGRWRQGQPVRRR